jgi:hypothetical protein
VNAVRWKEGSASLSTCGAYRWRLDRCWDESRPVLVWIMLNPSTADGLIDDQTIRKCVGFAQRWGYGAIVVVNLFAYRATKPRDLWDAMARGVDVVGHENDAAIQGALTSPDGGVAVAWGKIPTKAANRARRVIADLAIQPMCIGRNGDGSPVHPCMAAYTMPQPWSAP